jgi:hypothetical protein
MPKHLKRTALNSWHKEHGGQTVEFAGWEMPVAYQRGILEEHLATRRYGGLFDISHMGRFLIRSGCVHTTCVNQQCWPSSGTSIHFGQNERGRGDNTSPAEEDRPLEALSSRGQCSEWKDWGGSWIERFKSHNRR